MPLPAALLKRLASRGLVNSDSSNQTSQAIENEEIIAEDYDEVEDPSQYDYEPIKKPQENFWIERMKRRFTEGNICGYKGCPNKYNIFHKCTLYCINRWGDGTPEPAPAYLRRRNRLLKKYPLPKNWVEIYEPGCGVYYYWNTVDDMVSWLPPGHPKSEISKSAAILRRELEEVQAQSNEDEDGGDHLTEQDIQNILQSPMPSATTKRPVTPPSIESHVMFPPLKKPKARDLDKAINKHKSSRKRNKSDRTEPLDPMDPASYSDIPRGKWSDGLNTEGSSKSGVDSTVSGALFQMRPYPSPGAVLQANAAASASNTTKAQSESDSDGD